MPRSRFLIPPITPSAIPFAFFAERLARDDDFRADIKRIADLPSDQFETLSAALKAYPTFLDHATLTEMVAVHAPSADQRVLTGVISRLNVMMRESADSMDRAVESLVTELSKQPDFSETLAGILRDRLRALIVIPSGFARQKKAEMLAEATGAEVSNLAILCDIRPVFDEERKTIEGALTVTTLRVEVVEPDGRILPMECRLTEEQLEQLCKASEAAKRKLAALKQLLKAKSVPHALVREP